jgi:tetratricopeptide (TPR) repeat protein
MILRIVEFQPGTATLLPTSHPLLDEVVRLLKVNPEIARLALEGHTDNQGARAVNLRLSEARAAAVAKYLIRHGIDAARLVVQGYGPDRPIADNATFEGRTRNRRVEFHIVDMRVERRIAPGKRPLPRSTAAPLEGKLAVVGSLLHQKKAEAALREARAWYAESPTDTLSLVALGEALEATGQPGEAARAFGSLIDLHPSTADVRRHAGALLEALLPRSPKALALSIESYRRALEQRADHPSSHRMLGYALLRAGQPEQAFQVFAAARHAQFAPGRFPGVDSILLADVGLAAAAWTRAAPDRGGVLVEQAPVGRRDPGLWSRGLRHRGRAGALPLPCGGAVREPWPDGPCPRQRGDRSARRPGRPHVRSPPVRDHDRGRDHRPWHHRVSTGEAGVHLGLTRR